MRIVIWDKSYEPPTGYEYGPVPTDFGVGRAAYKWEPGIKEPRKLLHTIYRGGGFIERSDGSLRNLGHFTKFDSKEVLELLEEVAHDGLEIVHV